jgi:penicillin amidase
MSARPGRPRANRLAALRRTVAGMARLAGVTLTLAGPRRSGAVRAAPITLPGLGTPVEVFTDRWGVPHIYGHSRADVFAAQGYLHARDRLWQMELQRRLGHGTLAEILGESALSGDRFVRVLGLGRTVAEEVAGLAPPAASAVDAYARGVTAYLESHRQLPIEFRLLRHRPQPWTAADVLVWGKVVALVMSTNWAAELLRARVAARRTGRVSWPVPPILGPDLRPSYAGQGSNAWAVAASRSTTGAPLLACDPHLRVRFPIIWYENHVSADDLHVTGASMPGAPGIVVGHNDRIAWGVTNARVDVQDLYEERLDAAGRYQCEDDWLPLAERVEEIAVLGRAEPHREVVRVTRHGPLVTPVLGAGDSVGPRDLALAWTGLAPGELVSAVLALNDSHDWDSFRAALATWTGPAQTFVYADVDGVVGHALAGTVPRRADGHGTYPAPGWSRAHDWIGTVAPDRLPHRRDPADGAVVSANNRIDDADGDPPPPGEWMPDYRAVRIRALLDARPRHDVASFQVMQSDVVSLPGLALARLVAAMPDDAMPAGPGPDDGPADAARRLLAGWDGRLTADSPAGAVYHALRAALLTTAYADLAEPLGLTAGEGVFTSQPGLEFLEYAALPVLLARLTGTHADPGADTDLHAAIPTDTAALLADAWRLTVADLVARLGPDPATWRYGRLHELTIRHGFGGVPLLGRWLNRGPYPVGGDVDTVCAGTIVVEPDGTRTFDGASYRQICDLADWDRSVSVLPTGQSGRPESPHYADHTALWLRGAYHPMYWSRAVVERERVQRQVLVPSTPGRRRGPFGEAD